MDNTYSAKATWRQRLANGWCVEITNIALALQSKDARESPAQASVLHDELAIVPNLNAHQPVVEHSMSDDNWMWHGDPRSPALEARFCCVSANRVDPAEHARFGHERCIWIGAGGLSEFNALST